MVDFYNEWESYPAEWLRLLMLMDEIPEGVVDERSIVDVKGQDLEAYTQCHFFAGIGGWPLALRIAGWPENRSVWTGSCPCQPFSAAGKQKGFADERHLWPEFLRLITERHPPTIFGEQVAAATAWLGVVRSDLEALGYAVGFMPIEAASAGADHLRDRFWFVANDGSGRRTRSGWREEEQQRRTKTKRSSNSGSVADRAYDEQHRSGITRPQERYEPSDSRYASNMGDADQFIGRFGNQQPARQQPQHDQVERANYEWVIGADGKQRRVKPGIRLLAHGVPNRVAQLRALGNAIDSRPAAAFITAFLQAEADL